MLHQPNFLWLALWSATRKHSGTALLFSVYTNDLPSIPHPHARLGGGGVGVIPYISYIGMCGPKGYGFSAVLVINRVLILPDFGHFGHK